MKALVAVFDCGFDDRRDGCIFLEIQSVDELRSLELLFVQLVKDQCVLDLPQVVEVSQGVV